METWSSRWGNKMFPNRDITEVIQSLWVDYSWPDTACSASEQWGFVFSHWQMALAYCTTSLSIQVRGSGNSTDPSKNPRWPPWRGSTCMTFSLFSVKEKEAESSRGLTSSSWEWKHLELPGQRLPKRCCWLGPKSNTCLAVRRVTLTNEHL